MHSKIGGGSFLTYSCLFAYSWASLLAVHYVLARRTFSLQAKQLHLRIKSPSCKQWASICKQEASSCRQESCIHSKIYSQHTWKQQAAAQQNRAFEQRLAHPNPQNRDFTEEPLRITQTSAGTKKVPPEFARATFGKAPPHAIQK